jgi:DNA-binding transcriptional ArsR family regulator
MPFRAPQEVAQQVEFLASETLDLLNAMEFTSIAERFEGVDGWPERTRATMDPALREELDFVYTFPRGGPGVMGALQEAVVLQRKGWDGKDALVRFVRELDLGTGGPSSHPGVQGLVQWAMQWPVDHASGGRGDVANSRAEVAARLEEEGLAVEQHLAVYDDPAGLRDRIAALIERFYEEHYKTEAAARMRVLRRSVDAHRDDVGQSPDELMRRLAGPRVSCLADRPGEYSQYIFLPSSDMGPYLSCIDQPPLHVLYYHLEPEFADTENGDEEMQRLAQVYKALGDEQRLRILRLLRRGEMYVGEIAESTGLHQSVVSRHLTFLRAVGLVTGRKQNNMKFFSVNTEMSKELAQSLAALLDAVPGELPQLSPGSPSKN